MHRLAKAVCKFAPNSRFITNDAKIHHHPLYRRWQIRPNLFGLEERFFESWNRANMFYFVGRNKDLLVDTGTGIHNLPRYFASLDLDPFNADKKKPLYVVLTHCHFDHSGGLHQFQNSDLNIERCIHKAEIEIIKRGDQHMIASWVTNDEVLPKPIKGWSGRDYRVQPVQDLRCLEDGDVLDLGDWSFKVLHLPGHSPGSIGLFDESNGVMISGDTLYQTDTELVDWYPGSSVEDMSISVEKIHALAESGKIDLVLPGHNQELKSKEAILQASSRHLSTSTTSRRRISKTLSRIRANFLIAANRAALFPVPNELRELLMH